MVAFFSYIEPLTFGAKRPSARAATTPCNAKSDLLMCTASVKRSPFTVTFDPWRSCKELVIQWGKSSPIHLNLFTWLITRFKLNGLNAIVILGCGCFPMLPGRACPSPKHPHLRRPSLWPVRCQPNRPNTISPGWRLRHPCHLNVDVLWEVTRDKTKRMATYLGTDGSWVLTVS